MEHDPAHTHGDHDHEHDPALNLRHRLIVTLTHLSQEMGRAFGRQAGISLSRVELLHELWHAGEISQTELTKRLSTDGALITRFVKQMEKDGLIQRRVDPRDNRFTLVSLAPGGKAALDGFRTLEGAYETQLLAGLSEQEVQAMVRGMERMLENLGTAE